MISGNAQELCKQATNRKRSCKYCRDKVFPLIIGVLPSPKYRFSYIFYFRHRSNPSRSDSPPLEAVDEFSEVVVLAGNGWGVGALKILRGMYELVVIAAYIAKAPEASRAFADSSWTHRLKLWNRLSALDPTSEERSTPEMLNTDKSKGKKVEERKRCPYARTATDKDGGHLDSAGSCFDGKDSGQISGGPSARSVT
jgi:Family of unknown function (DUF5677)